MRIHLTEPGTHRPICGAEPIGAATSTSAGIANCPTCAGVQAIPERYRVPGDRYADHAMQSSFLRNTASADRRARRARAADTAALMLILFTGAMMVAAALYFLAQAIQAVAR